MEDVALDKPEWLGSGMKDVTKSHPESHSLVCEYPIDGRHAPPRILFDRRCPRLQAPARLIYRIGPYSEAFLWAGRVPQPDDFGVVFHGR